MGALTQTEKAAINTRLGANRNQTMNADAQNGTLSQYEGDLTQTPMYRRLYNQRVQDTSNAYNAARMQRSMRARMAGFGYTSPTAQTDNATIGAMEAGDMGRIGADTMTTLMPYQMQAAGMRGSNINTYGSEAGQALGIQNDAEKARLQREQQGGMFGRIAKLGMMGASMIPGIGTAVSTGLKTMSGMI